ncbi:unnamed protein product [Orchesella dallaii]|uniref:EGF-like domain-containing protein n=1 Tax=Orchesella dallaii TaxID=48710 RepID=A0ABP1PSN1_9HEXA
MNPGIILFFDLVFVAVKAHVDDESYLTFGKYCGSNSIGQSAPCNFEALLECNTQGICRCIEPRTMTFEGSTCAVLAGESCLPSKKVWLFDNVTTFQRDDYTSPCVGNATCNLRTKRCQCLPDFYMGIDKKCHFKLHEASCRRDADCEGEETHIVCNKRKICGCNDDLSILFNEEQLCRGIVGAPCDNFGRLCVPNAECIGESWSARECQCAPGFSKSPDGSCLVSYSNECSKEQAKLCNEKEENTLCQEGRCLCRSGQVWDESRKKCKQQVESRCDDSLDCGQGMFCGKAEKGDEEKRCKCNEGLIQVDYNCHPTYGQPCDYKPESSDNDSRSSVWICNPMISSISCIDGTCQCHQMEYYDEELNSCRGLAGSSCNMGMTDANYCMDNSICRLPMVDYYVGGEAICQCEYGFSRDEFDRCVENPVENIV